MSNQQWGAQPPNLPPMPNPPVQQPVQQPAQVPQAPQPQYAPPPQPQYALPPPAQHAQPMAPVPQYAPPAPPQPAFDPWVGWNNATPSAVYAPSLESMTGYHKVECTGFMYEVTKKRHYPKFEFNFKIVESDTVPAGTVCSLAYLTGPFHHGDPQMIEKYFQGPTRAMLAALLGKECTELADAEARQYPNTQLLNGRVCSVSVTPAFDDKGAPRIDKRTGQQKNNLTASPVLGGSDLSNVAPPQMPVAPSPQPQPQPAPQPAAPPPFAAPAPLPFD